MSLLVLDASVAAKWALPGQGETLAEEARSLLHLDVDFLVPDLFWAELGNIFWKAVQRDRWSTEDAIAALSAFQLHKIATIPVGGLLDEAMMIALVHRRSFYDSLYVALAVQTKTSLVTADERLVASLGTRFPVRWLGSFQ